MRKLLIAPVVVFAVLATPSPSQANPFAAYLAKFMGEYFLGKAIDEVWDGATGRPDTRELAVRLAVPKEMIGPACSDVLVAFDDGEAEVIDQTIVNSVGMAFVEIPAGEFQMGAADGYVDEQPPHKVRLTKPFLLQTTEVTQQQWETVMGANPSYFSTSGGGSNSVAGQETSRFPVETVSWYDAIEFCNKLSQREGLPAYYTVTNIERADGSIKKASVTIAGGTGYRLPTEAEWEYACRAGTTTPFHIGMSNDGRAANVNGKYPHGTTTEGPYLRRTTTVGVYAPNAFGLFDMHGNVWEWCWDGYDENAYKSRTGVTPDPVVNRTDRRVLRGGSWDSLARITRAAYRYRGTPGRRNVGNGFRVARTP